jgi:hypothetical protein
MTHTHRLRTLALAAAGLFASAVVRACGGESPSSGQPPTIAEEAFVAAMAELHHARLTVLDGELSDGDRARILARHGLEAADLLTFAEVHGGDVTYMVRVLDDVARATRQRDLEDPSPIDGPVP